VARTRNRKGWKLTALLAFGGMAWRMWRSRSTGSPAGSHMDKPQPELTPEPGPGPDSTRAETGSDGPTEPAPDQQSTSRPGTTPLSDPAERAPDDPESTQDQKTTPGREPDPVDEAEYESFPASDPPSWTR
jgi:hypothetical protein